jgi:general secretion pathway protein F
MPAFAFEALSADGHTRKGTIEADSAKAARSLLRAQALVPLKVAALANTSTSDNQGVSFFKRRVFSANALSVWTRQLAGLVSSGLPLERALASLSTEADREAERNLVARLRAEVNSGSTFAKALAEHPREFSTIYIAVIGAGEQSGQRGVVLEHLAQDLEDQQNLHAKLLGAALYPAIVSAVALGIVLFLMAYVVPQVASVFAGSKKALPFLTVVMLALSDMVRQYGGLVLAIGAIGIFAARQALKTSALRYRFDAAWLTLPIIGKLSRSFNAARFASTLAMLAAAGVPILKALQAAADTLSNHALRQDAQDALVAVREGAPLASALAQKKRFPGVLSMFARLGEQTGQLPLMLQRAAHQLSTEVQRKAMQLATLLEPLLIVVMGAVVMLIVLAVLLPIIEMNQLVR